MEQVKLLSMTVVLTVLIWASADSLVNEAITVSVLLEPVPAAGVKNMIVEASPAREAHEVVVSGPRKIVEDIQAQPVPLHVRLRIADRSTGPASITLDRAVVKESLAERWSEFDKLTIVSIQPPTLEVRVDHWVVREAAITIQGLTLAYDVEPQLRTTSTTVRLRESALAQFPAGRPLGIEIAALVERRLKDQPAGESAVIPVPLDVRPFGPDATLIPSTVEVTATVKAQRRTAQIHTVPILVAVSFANLEKPYRAVTREGSPLSLVTRSITVTGPSEEVGRLERGLIRAFGMIHLKQEDLEQIDVLRQRTPEYRLPEGVVLAEPAAPVEFKLILASTTEMTP